MITKEFLSEVYEKMEDMAKKEKHIPMMVFGSVSQMESYKWLCANLESVEVFSDKTELNYVCDVLKDKIKCGKCGRGNVWLKLGSRCKVCGSYVCRIRKSLYGEGLERTIGKAATNQ